MEQRYSIVTLGVADLERSASFYEGIGWRRVKMNTENIVFFQCVGVALALYPKDKLAADVGIDAVGNGFSGVTLAHNARSKPDVDTALKEAEAAGGVIVKPAQDVFWGGYSGYFQDPDGHLWEVAFNPFFALDDAGALDLAPG